MTHFLVVFERPAGRLVRLEPFTDPRAALEARFRAEREHRGSDVEVVVLTAESADALRNTHARYFSSVSEMATRGSSSRVSAAPQPAAG